MMDTASTNSATLTPNSIHSSNDETPRVKFLCSFLGSIMPRPQDGKLRYVGGETRIVTLPRDIRYEELMNKMKELYDGASVLKYQQPDEDLDALVSVVNDDDVTNMMEEYDKLGSADGFTKLRIFLFSHPDQDGSLPYGDGDDMDSEKRYVDALNNLNDVGDYRNQQPESPLLSPDDEMQLAEQYFNQMNFDAGFYNPRNIDFSVPPFDLKHLTIPPVGSGQYHVPVGQRYNEMDAPWSPSYYSPRHHGHYDLRSPADFPYSPSSARYCMPFGEDRLPEDYIRQQVNHQAIFEQQLQFPDNATYMPPGSLSGDRAGFPGNIHHGPSIVEGSSNFERFPTQFLRNQPHLEQTNIGNGLTQVPLLGSEGPRNRESLMVNGDVKLHHGVYPRDRNDPHSIRSDVHSHERGWAQHHHMNPLIEEEKTHAAGVGRLPDNQIPDPSSMSTSNSHIHGNFVDGHQVPGNYVHQRAGNEIGKEVFHDRAIAVPPHVHTPPPDEHGVRYGNSPYGYGTDNLYPAPHGRIPGNPLSRNVQSPMHDVLPPEAFNSSQQVNGPVNPAVFKGIMEANPNIDAQGPQIEPSQRGMGFSGTVLQENSAGQALKVISNPGSLGSQHHYAPGLQCPPDMLNLRTSGKTVHQTDPCSNLSDERTVSGVPFGLECKAEFDADVTEAMKVDRRSMHKVEKDSENVQNAINSSVQGISFADSKCDEVFRNDKSNPSNPVEGNGGTVEPDLKQPLENSKLSVKRLSFLPELMATVKKAAIEEAEGVKAKGEKDTDSVKPELVAREPGETNPENVQGDSGLDSDNDDPSTFKIELTKAEEEALARGLQTIKNEDLEEIRELGSGTYGSVYHGKWKGSDVAIKRIKASCFSGRPSERERLIADFWKEALILSSLHHPNVVSFYGIVRDGPDGSLATVTEFMVNGSLKQFLRKKDRTIDRRKRLIIAMDAAFGMEYLHGKKIVHFDLKCENLLVNMRDPQRPVCKIGDLGLSKVKQQTLVSGGVRGTLPWMAPELLSGKSNMVTEKIDVYSFGIVMWELLTGEEPYADMHCASIIGGIVNNSLRPQIPSWCDPEWKALMGRSWASDPAERPSFSEISRKLRSMAAAMNVK